MDEQLMHSTLILKVDVEWWTNCEIFVRCPLCNKIHRHGFAGDYNARPQIPPPCNRIPDSRYEPQFPTNWEIDKRRALFVVCGADPEDFYNDSSVDIVGMTAGWKSRPKWTEATEQTHLTEEDTGHPGGYTGLSINLALMALQEGYLDHVRNHLERSQDADIFLQGVYCWNSTTEDDEGNLERKLKSSGDTALHFAACGKYPEMVQLLLSRGANPNFVNIRGRTPLAEAALWGRLDNVRLLLNHAADKKRHCLRGKKIVRAVEFAQPTLENADERQRRLFQRGLIYQDEQEHSVKQADAEQWRAVTESENFQRDLDRRLIVKMLQGEGSPGRQMLEGMAFLHPSRPDKNLAMLAHFDLQDEWKTWGVLYRSLDFVPVTARSGWYHRGDSTQVSNEIQIAGRDWTNEVFALARAVGHDLPREDDFDHGIPGRFQACHAEKQLTAYFVNRHLFQEYELDEGDWETTILPQLSLEEAAHGENNGEVVVSVGDGDQKGLLPMKLRGLRAVEPANGSRKATVLISRAICDDCWRFVRRVNERLELEITLLHRCVLQSCTSCA